MRGLRIAAQAKAAPLPKAPDESDLEVSDEDIDFVDEYSQRLGFLTSLNRDHIDRCSHPLLKLHSK